MFVRMMLAPSAASLVTTLQVVMELVSLSHQHPLPPSPPPPSPHVHTHPSHSHDLHTHVIGGDSAEKSPSSGEIVNSSLTEPTFSIEEELRYARRFKEGYDLPDTKYEVCLKINHPEVVNNPGVSTDYATSNSSLLLSSPLLSSTPSQRPSLCVSTASEVSGPNTPHQSKLATPSRSNQPSKSARSPFSDLLNLSPRPSVNAKTPKTGRARVLTSSECQRLLLEKKEEKKKVAQEKEKRKQERELRKKQKEEEQKHKAEEKAHKAAEREATKAKKEAEKAERQAAKAERTKKKNWRSHVKLERRDKHHAQLLLHHVQNGTKLRRTWTSLSMVTFAASVSAPMWALEGNGFSAVAAGGSMKIVLMTRMLRRTVEGYVLCVNSCIRLFRA